MLIIYMALYAPYSFRHIFTLRRFQQLWSSKWSIKDEHKLLSELGGAGTTTGQTGYYDTHAGFPSVGVASSAADIYDTINTMSQATSQNLYTPPLAGSLGKPHHWTIPRDVNNRLIAERFVLKNQMNAFGC